MKFSIQSVYSWYRNVIRNPKYRWWVILGTLVYFILPFDIAPDFLPIVGQVDDVFLLTLLVSEVSQLLIEGFKARKGDVANPTENPTNTAQTVDVDAVPLK
ncbi:MAG: YkvA family protein [Nostocaceae cyanobacterium]|nr:YkvA family protein [Nostocaceae cyanobacterium]